MHRRTYLSFAGLSICGGLAGCTGTDVEAGEVDDFTVETVTEEISHPWGMAFLPDSRLLVTERDNGRLIAVDGQDGTQSEIEGTPTVDATCQGGLLDVTLHPEFPTESWLYLTYSAANSDGETTTHLGRGRLDTAADQLTEFEVLHRAEPFVDSTAHYGSRVVFGPNGLVYVTVGDRQFKNFGPDHVAQDPTSDLGSTLRLTADGSIPENNPFVGRSERRDAIYSYGHRNAQGMTVHPETGELWQSEHGEEDGDELNVIQRGGNYGWPVATYACQYGTREPVGDPPHEREDVVDPVYYWECGSGGFSPGGMTFYDGEAFPDWQGDLFVGNLADQYLGRFRVDGDEVEEIDSLLDGRGWRIRDVATAPETGHLYVLVDADSGPIVRLTPQ